MRVTRDSDQGTFYFPSTIRPSRAVPFKKWPKWFREIILLQWICQSRVQLSVSWPSNRNASSNFFERIGTSPIGHAAMSSSPMAYAPAQDMMIYRSLPTSSHRPGNYVYGHKLDPNDIQEQEKVLYNEQKKQEHEALHRTVSWLVQVHSNWSHDCSHIEVRRSSVLSPKCATIFQQDAICRNKTITTLRPPMLWSIARWTKPDWTICITRSSRVMSWESNFPTTVLWIFIREQMQSMNCEGMLELRYKTSHGPMRSEVHRLDLSQSG